MVRRRRFHTQAGHAYETLRNSILGGQLKPGEKLVLRRVAAEIGVSTIPVRDALLQLANERLVTGGDGRGWAVVRLSPDEVAQLYILRTALEVESARRCAAAAGPRDVARLRRYAEQIDALMAENRPEDARGLEWVFHEAVAEIGGCPIIREEIERSLVVLLSRMEFSPARASRHIPIVDAIEAGDPDAAERVMRRHCQGAATQFAETQSGRHDDVRAPEGVPSSVMT